MLDNERGDSMANWKFELLDNEQWGARGYFPKGEGAPHDEELLGQIVEVARKDGKTRTIRLTGISEWKKFSNGGYSVLCETTDFAPDDNGAGPNLPSAPQSAPHEIEGLNLYIALFAKDGAFHSWMKAELLQPSPEMIKTQEQLDADFIHSLEYSQNSASTL